MPESSQLNTLRKEEEEEETKKEVIEALSIRVIVYIGDGWSIPWLIINAQKNSKGCFFRRSSPLHTVLKTSHRGMEHLTQGYHRGRISHRGMDDFTQGYGGFQTGVWRRISHRGMEDFIQGYGGGFHTGVLTISLRCTEDFTLGY